MVDFIFSFSQCAQIQSNPIHKYTILIFVLVRKKNFLIKIFASFKTRCKKKNYFYNVLFYELVNVMNRWESVGPQTMGQMSRT